MNKAIFLDRDGTINKLFDKPYIDNPNNVELLPWVKKALKILKEKWYFLIVITNQTGVGTWYYTKEQAEAVNKKIQELLWFNFDWIYSCYHHPNDNCACRKPWTALVEQAIKDFNIDIKKSWFVWDKEKDVLTWKNIWCRTAYVGKWVIQAKPDIVANDLMDFVNKIENYV